MRTEERLLDKYGRDTGFIAPEGFLEDLCRKVESDLPAVPPTAPKIELSRWQRVKPYVYLAAMFVGIWLMMQMFHRLSDSTTLSLDNPPGEVVTAMLDDDYQSYFMQSDINSDFELLDDVSEEYSSIEEFEKDFGYELEPAYASIRFSDGSGKRI